MELLSGPKVCEFAHSSDIFRLMVRFYWKLNLFRAWFRFNSFKNFTKPLFFYRFDNYLWRNWFTLHIKCFKLSWIFRGGTNTPPPPGFEMSGSAYGELTFLKFFLLNVFSITRLWQSNRSKSNARSILQRDAKFDSEVQSFTRDRWQILLKKLFAKCLRPFDTNSLKFSTWTCVFVSERRK